MLYDDYALYTQTYKKEYGDRTLVLIEVGSFWELYDCDQHQGADMQTICNILNIQLSRKNKNIIDISRSNPLMAGFPSHALNRFLPLLIEENYTVVLVGQVTPPPNPKRDVIGIYSKGNNIENVSTYAEKYNMCIYIEKDSNIGVSLIDVTTGNVYLYECYSINNDKFFIFDEINRLFLSYPCCEIMFIGNSSKYTVKDMLNMSRIPDKIKVYDYLDIFDKDVLKIDYQSKMIEVVYSIKSHLTPLEYIDCEKRPLCSISFAYLVKFLFNHNKLIIEKLKLPEFLCSDKYMILGHNTLQQIELDKVGRILNRCVTGCGKRCFDSRIRNPLILKDEIEHRLEKISKYVDEYKLQGVLDLRNILYDISDVERINRRLLANKAHPHEIIALYKSLLQCTTSKFKYELPSFVIDNIDPILAFIDGTLSIDLCAKVSKDDININIFIKGYNNELDNIQNDIDNIHLSLNQLENKLYKEYPGYFKLECNERDGYYFSITQKRWKEIVTHAVSFFDGAPNVSTLNNYYKITNSKIIKLSADLNLKQAILQRKCRDVFDDYVKQFNIKFADQLYKIAYHIADIDVALCCALNAMEYKYVKPQFANSNDLRLTGLRHPLVERLNEDIDFVDNDIVFNDVNKGFLLYGLNAAGKSTLMKAIGLNVILAQAGMFVACSSADISIFTKLFSRISKNDDIERGQSTFMVEMCELRNILKRIDSKTLVIGDEICSGTESISALSIVAASIKLMSKMNTSFIFATHLHDLTKIPDIVSLKNIKMCHLHVEYDPNTKQLIYYRKIRDGQGLSTYGIEVCKALNMDDDFISDAIAIRNTLENLSLPETTKYNPQKYLYLCEVCKKEKVEEVHHIKYQCFADEEGYVGSKHINAKSNLAGLCSKCHDKIHNNELKITGKFSSSDGSTLVYETIQSNDESLYERILSMRLMKMSVKAIKDSLYDEGYDVSDYKIRQIIKTFKI